jgi:hypothetical protein
MTNTKKIDLNQIGQTIQAVIALHSIRLFKSDLNTPARSAITFITIRALVNQALADSDLPIDFILVDVDPSDLIKEQMVKDGYNLPAELESYLMAELGYETEPLSSSDGLAAA